MRKKILDDLCRNGIQVEDPHADHSGRIDRFYHFDGKIERDHYGNCSEIDYDGNLTDNQGQDCHNLFFSGDLIILRMLH